MPGGLEAIAMAALQELQLKTGGCIEENSRTTSRAESIPVSKLAFLPTSTATNVTTTGLLLDLDDNDKNKANLVRSLVGSTSIMKVQQQCSRQGPSSPAVVSSTSQEEQDDKQEEEQEEEQEENASSSHAARVVSFESMDSKCYDSSLSGPQQESDVADQVLAIFEAARDSKASKETLKPTLIQGLHKKSSPKNTLSMKKPMGVKKLPVKKSIDEKSPSSNTAAAAATAAATTSSATAAQTMIQGESETERFISKILEDPEKFLLSMEPHFSSSLNKTMDTKAIITDGVRPNDVLCGRGGETNHHTYVVSCPPGVFLFC
jgi:ribosomal protein L12E/L44/L45/RPP1/RPP2